MARRLGAAPSKLSFGDSAAQAGARRRRLLVRLPGIAPGRAPWRGAILLLNHNREIKRAGSVIAFPAHAISIKNKHLLVIYSIPARGFTAAVSVFRGTPPPKPLNCKSVSNHPGALISDLWADPTGEESFILCAVFSLVLSDIIETSFCNRSLSVHLSLPSFTVISGK
jgi:hypothetical protein